MVDNSPIVVTVGKNMYSKHLKTWVKKMNKRKQQKNEGSM